MFRQVSPQRFVDRSRVVEQTDDIRLQEHDIGTLSVALVVLPLDPPAQIVLRPHVLLIRLVTQVLLDRHGILTRSPLGR